MQIIAHRGYWKKKSDQNHLSSLKRALVNNYGIETDLRDHRGKIVISHDVPKGKIILFEDLLKLYKKINSDQALALNIKSDGLQTELQKLIKKYKIKNYFIFDMSIPETIKYSKTKLNIYVRLSEYENDYKNYVHQGLWVDQFDSDWITHSKLSKLLANNVNICLVSSELHKRDYKKLWKMLLKNQIYKHHNFSLCTDFPEKTKFYFNV